MKTLGIGLFVVAVALGGTLQADDKVDCSSASKFSDSTTYKRGDVVHWSMGGGAATEYRCTAASCKSGSPTGAGWEKVGECRTGTAK